MKTKNVLFMIILFAGIVYGCKKDAIVKEYILVSVSTNPGANNMDTTRLIISSGYPILESNVKNPVITQPNGTVTGFNYQFSANKQTVNVSFLTSTQNTSMINYKWTFKDGSTTNLSIDKRFENSHNYFSAIMPLN